MLSRAVLALLGTISLETSTDFDLDLSPLRSKFVATIQIEVHVFYLVYPGGPNLVDPEPASRLRHHQRFEQVIYVCVDNLTIQVLLIATLD